MTVVINGTTGITSVNGSAAAPSVTGTDTDTGIVYGTNTLSLATGGTTAVTVDSSQNVGIGTNSPSCKTEISAASATDGIGLRVTNSGSTGAGIDFLQSGVDNFSLTMPAGTGGLRFIASGSNERMRIDASGNVGIGTSSPAYKEEVVVTNSGAETTALQLRNDATADNTATSLRLTNSTSAGSISSCEIVGIRGSGGISSLAFRTSDGGTPAERARIDSSGNLLVGKVAFSSTTVGCMLLPDGEVYSTLSSSTASASTLNVYSTGAGAYRFYVGMDGRVNATLTTINAISDIRFKENIRDLEDGLNVVMALRPRKFDWKEGKGADVKNARGFIAQEFETVLPDLVNEWKDPAPEGEEPYKSICPDLVPTLVKAIQEQQAIIEQLRADVAQLKGQA